MPANKTKVDRLHDQMPGYFKTRNNINWKAIIEALGNQDQATADLVEEVRKQFFVKTSSRPYIDRLAANNFISRPKFVGMDDATFRRYIPILSYQPKQVKLIIDSLLDIFFFKDSTTSFLSTIAAEPFFLKDGWKLQYTVDAYKQEDILFNDDDFDDINNATAQEIEAAINRQAKFSFAVINIDNITKATSLRIFTNTVGAKGSVQITGGRAIIGLQPDGFISQAGTGTDTQWLITKIGDEVTFQWTGIGTDPAIRLLQVGDLFVNDFLGNAGSFSIISVDITNNSFTFKNIFGTPGTVTQTISDAKFYRPHKFVVYENDRRAVTWETEPGKISVEMPTSPPVVKRSLEGSAHINGVVGIMSNVDSSTSFTMEDASKFPNSGKFLIEELMEIDSRILTTSENNITAYKFRTRLISDETIYSYTGKTSNTLTGITPSLPAVASLNEFNLSAASRDSMNNGHVTTVAPHGYKVGEYIIVSGTTPTVGLTVSLNGTWLITAVPSATQVTFASFGDAGTATGGTSRLERAGMSNAGSRVILNTAKANTGILGPYMFDTNAAFVLSSYTTSIADEIKAGRIVRTLNIGANSILDTDGFVMFDYGTENQEGPVRYLYKPTSTTLALDPAYVFQKNHDIGSAVTMIRRKGPHQISTTGKEYAAYITDTSVAREILEELILSVKSVGIFIEFLIRFPEQFYATIDVYRSGVDPQLNS